MEESDSASFSDIPGDLQKYVVNYANYTLRRQLNDDDDQIWFAVDNSTGTECLIKQYFAHDFNTYEFDQYLMEVRSLSKLCNPYIFKFIGFTSTAPYCLITEFRNVQTLSQCLSLKKPLLNDVQKNTIAIAVVRALCYLQEKDVVLPWITTETIFMVDELPKLSVFPTIPRNSNRMWRAPEIISGNEPTPKTEAFMFGFILYELITGAIPYQTLSKEETDHAILFDKLRPVLSHDYPSGLVKLIKSCWTQSPTTRPELYSICLSLDSHQAYFSEVDFEEVDARLGSSPIHSANQSPSQSPSGAHTPSRSPNNHYQDFESSSDDFGTTRLLNSKPQKTNLSKTTTSSIRTISTPQKNDPKSKEFLEALKRAPDTLREDQYSSFIRRLVQAFNPNVPEVTVSAALDCLTLLIKRDAGRQAFKELDVSSALPYENQEQENRIFKLLYSAFEKIPDAFDSHFANPMSYLITRSPSKSLMILAQFAKRMNKVEDPWSILDLLVQSNIEKIFFTSDVGSEYITILYFLCANFAVYFTARISVCRKIFIRFLSSSDRTAVEASYKAICALYDNQYRIPVDRVIGDLLDTDFNLAAANLLLRMAEIPINQEIIWACLDLARNHIEGTLLLLRLLNKLETGKILLSRTNWILEPLPTLTDTLRLMLVMMKHKSLRPYISSLEELPEFLMKLASCGNKSNLVCMSSIIKRLNISQDMVSVMEEKGYFKLLHQIISIFNDEVVSTLCIDVIRVFASVGFSDDFLLFSSDLKSFLYKGSRLSRTSFLGLYTLSFHQKCAIHFQQMKINEDVIELFKEAIDEDKVNDFLRNLKTFSRL